jgi:Holliday junction resolvase-like predicted endonuclease
MVAMATHTNGQPFRPWTKNLAYASKGVCVMVVAFVLSKVFPLEPEYWWGVQVILAGFVYWHLKEAMVRSFGQRTERRAIKKLTSVVGADNIRSNVVFPGKGDIDCVIRIEEKIFNVEIKAFRDVKRITRAHLKQTLEAANHLQTEPVIWLPNFKEVQFRERNGVLLCACDPKRLVKKLA